MSNEILKEFLLELAATLDTPEKLTKDQHLYILQHYSKHQMHSIKHCISPDDLSWVALGLLMKVLFVEDKEEQDLKE
jgi:hypothetical protein